MHTGTYLHSLAHIHKTWPESEARAKLCPLVSRSMGEAGPALLLSHTAKKKEMVWCPTRTQGGPGLRLLARPRWKSQAPLVLSLPLGPSSDQVDAPAILVRAKAVCICWQGGGGKGIEPRALNTLQSDFSGRRRDT